MSNYHAVINNPSGTKNFEGWNSLTTGNINSANISALQTTDSILNSQVSILNSQVSSIQSSQWTTTQNGIEHNGNVFVKNLSVEESINIGSFRFSNGSKDTAIAPPPVIKDTIASDKPIVISAEKNISLSADTVLLGNGTGKVGIGIPPAPGEKLSVAGNVGISGNLRLSNFADTIGKRMLIVDAMGYLQPIGEPLPVNGCPVPFWQIEGNNLASACDAFIGTLNARNFNIRTNNVQRMTVTTTGNVGIGVPAPYKKLTVQGDVSFVNYDASNNNQVLNSFEILGNNAVPTRRGIALDNDPNGSFNFYVHSFQSPCSFNFKDGNGNATLMTILANGNVGIGIITPSEKLVVSGTIRLDDGNLNNGTTANSLKFGSGNTGEAIGSARTGTVNQFGLDFYTSYQNRMVITNSGYVGIGLTNPQNKLEVCGTIKAKKVRVEAAWCDYVFEDNYPRMTLEEQIVFYKTNKHLRGISPALYIEKEGLDVGKEMEGIIKNLEETRLDVLDLYKTIQLQQKQIDELKKEMVTLKQK